MGHAACTEPQCLYKGALYLTFTFIAVDITRIYRKMKMMCFPPSAFTLQNHFKLARKLTLFFPEVSIPSSIRRWE